MGISQSFAVVAIEGREPATSPGERLRGLEFDALHFKELLRKLGSNGRHIRFVLRDYSEVQTVLRVVYVIGMVDVCFMCGDIVFGASAARCVALPRLGQDLCQVAHEREHNPTIVLVERHFSRQARGVNGAQCVADVYGQL